MEKAERLVSVVAVEQETAKILARLKNRIFRVPDMQSVELANEKDPVRIERLLRAELTKIFTECSRELSSLQIAP